VTTYHVKAAGCNGRGFVASAADGYLKHFFDWFSGTPNNVVEANRGPGWYMLDNGSGNSTDPFIVISDQASPTPNSLARIVKITLPTLTGSMVMVTGYFWWDATTHTGVGPWFSVNVPTVDSGVFGFDFRGGAEYMHLGSLIASAFTFSALDTFDGLPGFVGPAAALSRLQNPMFLESGDTGNRLSSYHNITGALPSVDASGNLYFRLVFISGSTHRIDVFNNAARTNRVATTATFTTIGAKILLPDPGHSIGATVTVDSLPGVTVDTIVCRFGRVDLDTGDGANFVEGENYFITDFSLGQAWISYLRVASKVGDQLVLSNYTAGKNFSAGSRIGAYPHRFINISMRIGTDVPGSQRIVGIIPYVTFFGSEFADSSLTTTTQNRCVALLVDPYIMAKIGDDSSTQKIYMERIKFIESYSTGGGSNSSVNKIMGVLRNLMITNSTSLSVYTFGRRLDGVQWLDILHLVPQGMNSFVDYNGNMLNVPTLAFMVRDQSSES
jgi:hypothetical protein